MHLVTVNSETENLLLYNKGASLGTITARIAVWIGHRDLSGLNNYVAVQPNAGVTPTFFTIVAPLPAPGQCAVLRDQGGVNGAAFSWQTRACNLRRPFICEMELPCTLVLSGN
ncbi:hypothetical protein B566_EDAN017072 [Ephemera danica]|nr:hypothetical protein B566_EDAN017072 [Ephemera danica]